MKPTRFQQVRSWLLVLASAILSWYDELFFGLFIVAGQLRPDLLSKQGSDAIISRYKGLAMFGAFYASIIGLAIFALTWFEDRLLAASLGLRVVYITFWPFALMFSLNEYRIFRGSPNNAYMDSPPTGS